MNVAAIVLAAGRASRMGFGKLTATLWGAPVIAHAADAALASRASTVVVVVGDHEADVRAALGSRNVTFVANPEFAQGLSTSLRAGIRALSPEVTAIVVCLGDMPCIRSRHVDALVAAHEASHARAICVPVHGGRRGNPVLWPRWTFGALAELDGDRGGRLLLEAHAADVVAVPIGDDAVLIDVDTPEALAALQARGR
jgi:molybdenum cofactor cytidylyltransferase